MDSARLKRLLERFPARQLTDDKGNPINAILLPPARVQFCHLVKPKEDEKQKAQLGDKYKPSYEAAFCFPKGADLGPLKSAIARVVNSKFADLSDKQKAKLSLGLKKQDELSGDYDGFEDGGLFINAKTQFKPEIFSPTDPKQKVSDDEVYSGVWVRLKVSVHSFDVDTNKGVYLGIVAMQKLADDERFSGGGDKSEGFEGLEAEDAAFDGMSSGAAKAPAKATGKADGLDDMFGGM